MREKDFKNLTVEGRQLWIFNKLNNHVEKTSMNIWAFYAIMSTNPMIYILMIFAILTYDSGTYAYMIDYVYPMAIFMMVIMLAGICSMIFMVIDMSIRWYKDYKIKRDYTKHG